MTRALALLAVLLAVSCLEGLWVWLLTAALSQLEGQVAPPLPALALLIFVSWLTTRALSLAGVALDTRRAILVAAGLGLALLAATVHAGLMLPVQLILGHHDPDYRGSAVALGLLVAYLWARGLALAARASRPQVVNHVLVSTFILANILLVLPLAGPVRESGLTVVIGSFFAALAGLLLVQIADTESHQLTKAQWFALTAGAAVAMVSCAALFTGVLANGLPQSIGDALGRIVRFVTPVTNMVILGIGYLAHYVTLFILYLRAVHGGDPEAVQRAQEEAEQARPRFDNDSSYGPPEIMTLFAILVVLGLLVWWIAGVYGRLVQRGDRRDRSVGSMSRLSVREGDLLDGLRDALGRLPGLGGLSDGLSGRAAEIRRHYRAFQTLMARAQLPREAAQTPIEYQGLLSRRLPNAAMALATISDAYMLARYAGPRTPLPDPADMASAIRNVRALLQGEAHAGQEGAKSGNES